MTVSGETKNFISITVFFFCAFYNFVPFLTGLSRTSREGWTAVRKASQGKMFSTSFTLGREAVHSSSMDALQPQEAPCRLFERKIAPFICTVANFLIALLLFCRVSRFGGEIDCSGISVSPACTADTAQRAKETKKLKGFKSLAMLDVESSVIFEEGFLVLTVIKAFKAYRCVSAVTIVCCRK